MRLRPIQGGARLTAGKNGLDLTIDKDHASEGDRYDDTYGSDHWPVYVRYLLD